MAIDTTKANEVKLTGVLGTQQISATFSKQVLYINAKDTKDNQWKQAEMEIYIKPDLNTQAGAQDGDKIYIEGWLAFNFWNGRSFPRIVVTSVQVIEKAGAQQNNQAPAAVQPTQPNYNAPQPAPANTAPQAPQAAAPQGGPQIPEVPGVPTPPGM
jgi:single-stranded DNA-binding protein